MSTATSQRAIVVGSSFAGLTAALELRKRLHERHEVVVLDPREDFTFIPSLIWLPFGVRDASDITFPVAPLYTRRSIRFVNQAGAKIDAEAHVVTTSGGEELTYDRLLVATGPRLAFEKIPASAPSTASHSRSATSTTRCWPRTPGTATSRTPAPSSSAPHRAAPASAPHTSSSSTSGTGSRRPGSPRSRPSPSSPPSIEGLPNTVITDVRNGEIELDGGRVLPFAYSMIVPPFTGVDAVRDTPGLANPIGFVPIDDEFRHHGLPDVYAAGVATAIAPPEPTAVPAGVPKTGQMSETMAKVAAHNIAADIQGGPRRSLPLADMAAICVLDAGNNGIVFKADHVLAHGQYANGHEPSARVMAGPHAHWAKLAFERYFLASRKRGIVAL
jgi:sulfide:quinone oxidoreductase